MDAGPGIPPSEGTVTASCSPDGWCWENPLPTGNDIAAVWAVAPTDAWFVGAHGTVIHWDGAIWSVVPAPTTADLQSVWAGGSGDVWVDGRFHWNGSIWTTPEHQGHVWGSSSSDVWVVQDLVWHFDGHGWSQIATPHAAGYGSVSGSGPADVWITPGYDGSGHADLRLFHWNGSAMETLTRPADPRGPSCNCDEIAHQVWSSSATDAWIATDYHVLHWDGATFHDVPPPDDTREGTSWGGRIWGTGPTDVWILGEDLAGAPTQRWAFFRWDGSAWTVSDAPVGMNGLTGTGPHDAWLVGSAGRVMHYDGSDWALALPRSTVLAPPGEIVDAWTDGNTLYAVARTIEPPTITSALYRFDGSAWSMEDIGAEDPAVVTGTSASDVWVGTSTGVRHFDGTAWSESSSDALATGVTALWARSSNDVWAGTYASTGAAVARWDGTTWSVWPTFVPSATMSSVLLIGGAGDDVWIGDDTYYPNSGAHVSLWDGSSLASNVMQFGMWRHESPRVGLIAERAGNAWLAACDRIVHVGATSDGTTMFSTASSGSYPCDYDPEIILARGTGSRLWAARGRGYMMTYDGSSWSTSETGASVFVHAMVTTDDGVTRALGSNGSMLRHGP